MDDNKLDPRDYQDDLDTDASKVDRATQEETDNLADTAGIPEHELARELKRLKNDELDRGDDDAREDLEDRDEDMGQSGKL